LTIDQNALGSGVLDIERRHRVSKTFKNGAGAGAGEHTIFRVYCCDDANPTRRAPRASADFIVRKSVNIRDLVEGKNGKGNGKGLGRGSERLHHDGRGGLYV
jgi:hypothetical protein